MQDHPDLHGSSGQLNNNNTYGATSRYNGMSTQSLTKTAFRIKVVRLVLFGLCLYLVDVVLHLCIASHYLTMRQCHRSITHTLDDFKLDNFVNFSSFSTPPIGSDEDEQHLESAIEGQHLESAKEGQQHQEDFLADKINSFLHDGLYLTLRDKVIKILPTHWVQRIIDIVSFQIGQHNFSQIPMLCTLNGQHFTSLPHMVTYVCKNAFTAGITASILERNLSALEIDEAIDSKQTAIFDALDHLIPDKSTEDAIAQSILKKNMTQLMTIIFKDVLGNDNIADHELVQKVAHRFTQTFDKEEDVQTLSDLFSHEEIFQNVGKLFDAIGSIDKEYLDIAAAAFAKIKPENIPAIEALLGKLGLKLATFISDPSVFVQFFGDPAKGAVLLEVQKLLPTFDPVDINAILTIKIQFDKAMPDGVGEKILGRILDLPMGVLFKVFSLNLTPDEMAAVQRTLRKLLTSDATKALIEITAKDLRLFSAEGRNLFLSNCTHDHLEISCIDNSTDLCPNGHLQYGLVTIGPVALPGILFALSEFFHHHAFRFGGSFGRLVGQNWGWPLRLILLPFYVLIMIPLVVGITVYQYLKALRELIRQQSNKVSDTSNQKIPEIRTPDDSHSRWREEYDNAIQLHSLQAQGESFIQIIMQLFFMILLVILGTGTVVAGVGSAQSFFDKVFPLTVASLFISTLSVYYSAWRLQRGDFHTKEFWSIPQTLTERLKQGISFIIWFSVTKISQIFSVVTLSLLAWIELFSGDLTPEGYSINIHILPFLILVLAVPVNIALYLFYVREDSVFRLAHGALSAIFPSRYFHRSDRSKTKKFLAANQLTGWITHISAWLVYSAAIYVRHQEEAGLLRLLPVAAALITMGPLLGAIYWAISIDPMYDSRVRSGSFMNPSGSDCGTDGEGEGGECDGKKSLSKKRMLIFHVWQLFTIVCRVISFSLLCYVYYEHWVEVGGNSVRLAVLETIPYGFLILLGNVGLQYMVFGGSFVTGIIAIFLPNQIQWKKQEINIFEAGNQIHPTGKRKLQAQRSTSTLTSLISSKRSSSDDAKVGRYLVLNIIFNAILHILLWVVLTFYCWECTKLLSLEKLTICFPTAIALWISDLVLTAIAWRTAIRTGANQQNTSK